MWGLFLDVGTLWLVRGLFDGKDKVALGFDWVYLYGKKVLTTYRGVCVCVSVPLMGAPLQMFCV